MPFESDKQRKAMYAAAAGKGYLGIPQKVAKKFIKHAKDEADLNMWLLELFSKEIAEKEARKDTKQAPALLTPPQHKGEREYTDSDFRQDLDNLLNKLHELKDSYMVPRFGEDEENEIMVRLGEPKADSVKEFSGDPKGEIIGEPAHNTVPVDKMAGAQGRAAGILFLTNDFKTLLIRRGDGGDYPKTWCVPGGHQNAQETLEECARRECHEEVGYKYDGELEVLYDDGQFCTYIARNIEPFEVKLNYESTGYDWCHVENPDLPLHPGLAQAVKAASAKTEYDVAELIRENILPSPQMYANIMLLAIRITGTGLAYRSSIGEHVWRDPSLYLNEEFLKRCNGLIVIMDHPETAVLTTKEFKNRAVGSIILPYIQGDEVWGIAKIYDEDAIKEINEGEVSTSPSVVFDNTAGNTTLTTESGEPLLIEGVPFLLDHIAIVTKARGSKGVWDKGGDPAGVLLTNPEVSKNE